MKISRKEWYIIILGIFGYILFWLYNFEYAIILIIPFVILVINKLSGKKLLRSIDYFTVVGVEENLKKSGKTTKLRLLYVTMILFALTMIALPLLMAYKLFYL